MHRVAVFGLITNNMKTKNTTDTNVSGVFTGFVLLVFYIWGIIKGMDMLVYLNIILLTVLSIGTYAIRMKFR